MQLPLMLPWQLAQNKWKSQIDPILSNPLNNISILHQVSLSIGDNVINHKLGQKQQGWIILDIDGASLIYRYAPFNNLTLTLHSSAAVNIILGVY